MYAIAPVPVIQSPDPLAARRLIARLLTRIISRAYGTIDQIISIDIGGDGLITCLFRDDDENRKLIRLELGDRIEYKQVQNGRADAVSADADQYLVAYANSIGQRTDKVSKPKNCKVGLSCKGACISKTDVCRADLPEVLNRQEISDLNNAVIKSQSAQIPPTNPQSDNPYEGQNIRQLKEKAREKGILRYSYMTQDQLKGALKIADENPDYQENIRKTLQRQKDEATLKKSRSTAIGRALGVINPVLGRQYNLIANISKRYENNPTEARILGVAALLGISVVTSKILNKKYKEGLVVSASDAEKLADDRRKDIKDIRRESVTFVVGNYSEGSKPFKDALKSSRNSVSSENAAWLKDKTEIITVNRQGEGTPPPADILGRLGYSVTEGYKATLGKVLQTGRDPEAVSLAADLFNYGSKAVSLDDRKVIPAINIVAAEDGGNVAREALEVLSKIQRDIAKRINLVTLGTPYFGVTDRQIKETNLMGDQDPWNLTPFKKGGSMTIPAQGVSGHSYKDYLKSGKATDALFSAIQANTLDRRWIEDFVVARKPTVAVQIAPTVKQRLADLGYTGEVGDAPQDLLDKAINQAKRERAIQRERDRVAGKNPDEPKGDSLSHRMDSPKKKLKCTSGNKQCGNVCVSSKFKCKDDPASPARKGIKSLEGSTVKEKDSEGLRRPNVTAPLVSALAGAGIFYGATQLLGENGVISPQKASEVKEETQLALTLRYQDLLQASGFRGVLPKTLDARDENEFLENKDYIKSKAKEIAKSIPERKYALGDETITNEERLTYVGRLLEDPVRKDEFKFSLFKAKSVQGTNPEDIAAIRHYSGTKGYKEMNMTARGLHKELLAELQGKWDDKRSPEQVKQEAFADIRMANSGLDSLPAYKGLTYRGLTLNKELTDTLQVGAIWKESGFTSTTKNPLGLYPGNVIMRVKSSSGRDISSFEKYPNNEVLFKTNTDFVVTGRKKIKRLGKEFYLIDLKDSVSESDKNKIEKVEKSIAYTLSDKVLEKAKTNEVRVTPLLRRLSGRNNMRLEGLDYRFKEKESMARKIRDRANISVSGSMSFNDSAKMQAESLNDGLRYTLVSPNANYNENISKVRSGFKAKGYSEAKYWDAWKTSDVYKGVNITFKNNSDKSLFEVQIHTEESLLAKQEIHPLYESFRSTETSPSKKKKLLSEMRSKMRSLKKPR